MSTIANSWWMYALGILVVLVVLSGSIFFIYRSYKDAKEIGMDTAVIKKTIFNSAIFTILPSISILIGVVALSGTLGIPLPWIRLTVIGALHYEGVAANAAYEGANLATMTPQMFVTIACVMTLGILSGPIYCLFGFKAYDKKILSKAKDAEDLEVTIEEASVEDTKNQEVTIEDSTQQNEEAPKKQKKSFGTVLFDAVFIAMICSFLAVDIAKLKNVDASPIDRYIPFVVIIVTFCTNWLLDIIVKKFNAQWLRNFTLGLSMVVGMAVAVILG